MSARAFLGFAVVAGGVALLLARRVQAYAVPAPADLSGYRIPDNGEVPVGEWQLSGGAYYQGLTDLPLLDLGSMDALLGLGFSSSGSTSGSYSGSGYEINNPGNIEYSASNPWLGQIGRSGRWAVFSDVKYGVRAMGKLLETYYTRYGLQTIAGLVTRYAPPGENDTATYIRNVAAWSGLGANTVLRLDQLPLVVSAMLRMESGPHSFSVAYISTSMGVA